jgi:phosphoribosylformylglycinamidine synthase subunit PurQ / glutaminase
MLQVAVVQYPGSNCDLDALEVLQKIVKVKTDLVWHKQLTHDTYDGYVLPGGFSYGDYLRAGAIAAHSPSLKVVQEAAEAGKPILGICNGFQILVEANLLPGAVLRNVGLRFVCKWINLRVDNNKTPFTKKMKMGQLLRVPIAHNEGRFYLEPEQIRTLEKNGQIILRYTDSNGDATVDANPNGSFESIAGISNPDHNVMGLMPHPERASQSELSPYDSAEGRLIFDSMVETMGEGNERRS